MSQSSTYDSEVEEQVGKVFSIETETADKEAQTWRVRETAQCFTARHVRGGGVPVPCGCRNYSSKPQDVANDGDSAHVDCRAAVHGGECAKKRKLGH
eukprot:7318854-Prymnesium_polylepis.2